MCGQTPSRSRIGRSAVCRGSTTWHRCATPCTRHTGRLDQPDDSADSMVLPVAARFLTPIDRLQRPRPLDGADGSNNRHARRALSALGDLVRRRRRPLLVPVTLASDASQKGEVQRTGKRLAAQGGVTPLVAAARAPIGPRALVRFWTKHRLLRAPVPLTAVRAMRRGSSVRLGVPIYPCAHASSID